MQPILLLHGAIGAKDQLEPLASALKENFYVHTMNYSGHGGESFSDKPFSIASFANDVLHFIDKEQITSVNIFGYSMGGYVGMYLARHFPARVDRLVTLATKYEWDEAIALNEIKMLDPTTIRQKLPLFASQLEKRHAPNDWALLLEKTKEMLIQLGIDNALKMDDYPSINTPCLILRGDRDKMVSMEETVNVFKQLPVAQLGILPATPHPIEHVNVGLLAVLIQNFFL